MTRVMWDAVEERRYELGVDHGVLYPRQGGTYDLGVPWNGLVTVTESPSGAETNKHYADNIEYLSIQSAETFGGTIEAFMYPDEFEECDGTATIDGVRLGMQNRKPFGLSYRTIEGDAVDGNDAGYKLHLVYGATVPPTEKAFSTLNDSPEPITFSWEFSTTPVNVGVVAGQERKPTAILTIPSRDVDPTKLAQLEDILYGTAVDDPRLPLPAEVFAIFGAGVTDVNMAEYANQPSYDDVTHVVTLPAVTGVQWQINGVDAADGAQPALDVGETAEVTAVAEPGYNLVGDDRWVYDY